MAVWEDIKKIGNLAINQTKGQKEILLANLKIKSYSDKRDIAFTKLGGILYPAIKEGVEGNIDLSDGKIKETVQEISSIESEMQKTQEDLSNLKSVSAGEINKISSEVGTVWKKTKSAIAGAEAEKNDAPPKSSSDDVSAENERAD